MWFGICLEILLIPCGSCEDDLETFSHFPVLVDVCPEVPSTFLAINIPKHRDYGRAQLPLLLGLRGLLEFVRLPGVSRISCPRKVVPGAIAVICRQELFLYSRGLGLARQTGWTWTGESGG